MAFWPGRGDDLSTIDYSRMRVGVVQFFLKNSVVLCNEDMSSERNKEQLMVCVYWKQKHPVEEWFGISATVCVNMFEPTSACNFIPAQCLAKKCAHCMLDNTDICGSRETVFVACPMPIKYSM
jgi:hypothetical protein